MIDTVGSARAVSFSRSWLVISIVVFSAVEILLGGVAGDLLAGKYVSQMLHLRVQVALNLTSYLIGGFLVGVISPGIRMAEPAIGAVISMGLVLIISWFLPYTFLRFGFEKLLLGGGIAFVLALAGARAGERMMGNIRR